MLDKKVTLIPISMITPTKEHVYAPSKLESEAEVTEKEFLKMADNSKLIPVSFDDDGKSNPVQTAAYWSRLAPFDLFV